MTVLNIWQIDTFEGGRGSRASYLQGIGDEFTENTGIYVHVNSLSSSAARENLRGGNFPDLISYGAGTFGLEKYLFGEKLFYTWCNGGYCFLSLSDNADFSDLDENNCIVNQGTENFSKVAAALCGLNNARFDKPTGAYVKLINGEYKYMLGTQRDILRLKTRGASFKIKPVTEFNDLYQNISVAAQDRYKQNISQSFIKFLLNSSKNINKIGMLYNGINLYDDELHIMENVAYEYKLIAPLSEQSKNDLDLAIANNDIKKIKSFLI